MSTLGAELFWILGSLTAGIEFSFFESIVGAELFWEIELFPLTSRNSDLGSFISSELGLVALSDIALVALLFGSRFSSIKNTI